MDSFPRVLRYLRDELHVHCRKVDLKLPRSRSLKLLEHIVDFLSGRNAMLDELCSYSDDRIMQRTQVRPRRFGLRQKEAPLTHLDQAHCLAEVMVVSGNVRRGAPSPHDLAGPPPDQVERGHRRLRPGDLVEEKRALDYQVPARTYKGCDTPKRVCRVRLIIEELRAHGHIEGPRRKMSSRMRQSTSEICESPS